MSKIKILDATQGLRDTAKSIFDTIQEMQTSADQQIKSMREVESKIVSIEKTKQAREEQRKKQAAEQKALEQQQRMAEQQAAAAVPAKPPAVASGGAPAVKEPVASAEAKPTADAADQAPAAKAPEKPVSDAAQPTVTASTGAEQLKAADAQGSTPKKAAPAAAAAVPAAQKSAPADQQKAARGATKPAAGPTGAKKEAAQKQQPAAKKDAAPAQEQQQGGGQRRQGGQQKKEQAVRQDTGGGREPAKKKEAPAASRQKPRQPEQNKQQGGGGRQQGQRSGRASDRPAASAQPQQQSGRKKRDDNGSDRKKKKAGIRERSFSVEYDEMPKGPRKRSAQRKQQKRVPVEPMRIDHAVITEETVSVKLLSEKIGKPVNDILKKLLLLGMTSNINSQIDFDAAQLVASEFGVELEQKVEKTAEEILIEEVEDTEDQLVKRPPVVTIMGHVDHGKTSLLDRIRVSRVTETEAGGITQHIGAYQVELDGDKITFIDTPGHEAFTAMRARGAQVTDVAIIVVAADDGIMPQTIEAINHAKSADVPIIVAINKIDRENANVQKIMQELTEYEILPEEWGGDTVVVPVSAKTGEGIDKLLEMIILVADMQELRANPNRMARGTIVEAQLDKGRGPVATVLVQNGTLKIGDTIIAGVAFGRVRAMVDDRGNSVREALPSQPVEVIGFNEVPIAGDLLHAAEGALSKKVAEERRAQQKVEKLKKGPQVSLDDLFNQINEGQIKDLNIVVKADVQGSVEAVRQSLEKLSNDEVRVRAIHTGVGAITETDVLLASAANAIIIGFNVRPDNMAVAAAEREQVDVRLYRVIYKAIEDIESAMNGMLEPEYAEVVIGHAEVRQIWKATGVGTIAGSYVQDGVMRRNAQVRLVRDGIVVHEGVLSSLRRFKDDVREVATGYECGMTIENYNDIKEGDVIEGFEMQQIER